MALMQKNKNGLKSLSSACGTNNASSYVIAKLIETAGSQLVMQTNKYDGGTALNAACRYGASIDVVAKLVEV